MPIKLLITISEEIYQEAIRSGYSHQYDEEVASAISDGTPLSEVEKVVDAIIAMNGAEGAKAIVDALVRAMKSRDAFARVGAGAYGPALIRLVIAAIRREDEEEQRNG